MADLAGAVTQSVIGKLVDPLYNWTSTQLGYVWSRKTNFKKLETELGELRRIKLGIENSIQEAENNGEEIEKHVEDWLHTTNEMIDEVIKMVEQNKEDKMKCFRNLCPDLKKRYRSSKNAVDKVNEVSELRSKELAPVSHPRVLQGHRHLSNEFNEKFQSRTNTLNSVIDALKDVNMVGIYGLGGVGKTTLAKEVGQKVKEMKLFDSVVFVEVTEEPNYERIRGRIADMLNLKLRKEDPSARADELYEMLEQKSKILIIFDNIFQKIDLKEIGIPLADGDKGCWLLLTARKRDVWSQMDCPRDFPLDILDNKDSWTLFAKTTGSCIENADIKLIAKDVAHSCGGLPVAIVTVAKALRDKSSRYWKNALQQIQHYPEDLMKTAYSCIQWSYDNLKSDFHKSTFLLCCIMASISEASVDNLVRYGLSLDIFNKWEKMEQSRDHVCALLEDLRDCSLLLLESSNDEIFSIHDVVREVGTKIIGPKIVE